MQPRMNNRQRINKPTSLPLGHRPDFLRRGHCLLGHNPPHCHKAEIVGGQIYQDRCGNADKQCQSCRSAGNPNECNYPSAYRYPGTTELRTPTAPRGADRPQSST